MGIRVQSRFSALVFIYASVSLLVSACKVGTEAENKATINRGPFQSLITAPAPTPSATSTGSFTIPSSRVYPLDGFNEPIRQGQTYTFTSTSVTGATLTCRYETVGMAVTDPNYAAAGTNCTSLPSLVESGGVVVVSTATFSSGVLTWTPTNTQRGTYKFTIAQSSPATSSSFYVTVRENFTTANLLTALDASVSEADSSVGANAASVPRLDGGALDDTGSWVDLLNSLYGSLAGFATVAPWSGTGVGATPYRLLFDGAADEMSLGTALSGRTKMMVSAWLSSTTPANLDDVILSTGGGSAGGFVLKQSELSTNKLELLVGKASYSALVTADNPVGYWRLGETSGTTAASASGSAGNGTYAGTYTLGTAGAISGDTNTAFTTTAGNVSLGNNAAIDFDIDDAYSLEAWVKSNSVNTSGVIFTKINPSVLPSADLEGFELLYCGNLAVNCAAGAFQFRINHDDFSGDYVIVHSVPGATLLDGNWHHVVVTYNGYAQVTVNNPPAKSGVKIYIDGVEQVINEDAVTLTNSALSTDDLRIGARSDGANQFIGAIDEPAVYDYVLSPQQVKNHYQAGANNYFPENATLAKGPLAYWRLNEESGTTASDLTPGAVNGTYNGAIVGIPEGPYSDVKSFSARFDGVNDYVDLTPLTLTTKALSVSAWIKPTDLTTNASYSVVYQDTNTVPDYGLAFTTNGTQLVFYVNTSGDNETTYTIGILTVPISAATYTDGNWHHLVATYDGANMNLYSDGTLIGGPQAHTGITTTTSTELCIGCNSNALGTESFKGQLGEIALFNRALSTTEISSIYASSVYYKCQTAVSFVAGESNFISALWDGTYAKLFVNGEQHCSVAPGTTFTPSTDLYVGATSTPDKHWGGALADIKVYGTSNGTVPGTATTVKSDFDATANRFRPTPVANIATSGLVLHLDAANAKRRLTNHAVGCAAGSLHWQDLSTSLLTGLLMNYTACVAGTSGWVAASPYYLEFDGVDDYVDLGSESALQVVGPLTVEAWVRNDAGSVDAGIAGTTIADGYQITFHNGTQVNAYIDSAVNTISAAATASAWHQIVFTWDGTTNASSMNLYVDGALVTSGASSFAGPLTTWGDFTIGSATSFFNGDIAKVAVYNRAIDLSEVKQNCEALETRFGITCN